MRGFCGVSKMNELVVKSIRYGNCAGFCGFYPLPTRGSWGDF